MNIKKLLIFLMVVFCFACAGQGKRKEILPNPFLVSIDSVTQKAFVVDRDDNTLSIIDLSDDSVLDGEPILNSDDTQILPSLPLASVVQNVDSSLSRIFISGNESKVVVLEFDGTTLSEASFSPIQVGTGTTDVLAGLAFDSSREKLFVSNSSDGQVYVYDANDGSSDVNSPINIGGRPYGLSYDVDSDLLAIAQDANDNVSFLDASDLSLAPVDLDLTKTTKSVGLLSNDTGTVLFFTSPEDNASGAYLLNLSDLSSSTQIGSLVEQVGPNEELPNPNVLTGLVSELATGELSDGILKAFVTQSSGDLLILEVSSSLNSLSFGITTVGAISGEGIDTLNDGNGFLEKVYFASPGVGTLTIIDALTDLFLDQII